MVCSSSCYNLSCENVTQRTTTAEQGSNNHSATASISQIRYPTPEEEKFEVGVRQSAMDYDAHTYEQQTADQADPNLDYDNFASLMRLDAPTA